MGREKKDREASSDATLSWAQFWAYMKSNRCTNEMRAWTLRYTNLEDALDGTVPVIQFEILEYAPVEIIQHYARLLHPSIQAKLLGGISQLNTQTQQVGGGLDLDAVKRRYEELRSSR
jgi:hypothetical protein